MVWLEDGGSSLGRCEEGWGLLMWGCFRVWKGVRSGDTDTPSCLSSPRAKDKIDIDW